MPDDRLGILRDTLEAMVPFHMAELHARHATPANLTAIASRAGQQLGSGGDALLFPSKPSGRTLSREAQTLNALAEGIAAAELLQPGEGARILNHLAPRGGVAA